MRREKAQIESSTTRKVRDPDTQEAFEEPKRAEHAAKKAMKEAAYAAKAKKMKEVELLPPAPA